MGMGMGLDENGHGHGNCGFGWHGRKWEEEGGSDTGKKEPEGKVCACVSGELV